ncbi:hypothetical protein PENSUB_10312 [Penicillium subrubescens]|uniref:Uncharacterized protein n=2 Tax=Penicillium subrubescens TaxID=1316194 RepID=A0A1Q5TBB9_9EURO|nr:hypothetical protein PENSUB_10312 [Penicillium subrubescens]
MGNKEDLLSLFEWIPWTATLVGRALTLAILLGEQQLLDVLMKFGPDVTQEITIYYHDSEMDTGIRGIYTPLQAAVKHQFVQVATELAKSADVATALQIASLRGYIGIVQLLDLGADVNEGPAKRNGRTALQGAAEYGRIDMLHMLLDKGPLVVGDAKRSYHKAVDLAERNGHMAAAKILRHFRRTVEPSLS